LGTDFSDEDDEKSVLNTGISSRVGFRSPLFTHAKPSYATYSLVTTCLFVYIKRS